MEQSTQPELDVRDSFVRDRLPPRELWPDIINLDAYPLPAQLNCAGALLAQARSPGRAGRPCLRDDEQQLTYGEVADRVDRIARLLVEDHELRPGERVMIGGPNSVDLATVWLAVIKAGGVAVCTMAMLRAHELSAIAELARPRLALCAGTIAGEFEAAAARVAGLDRVIVFDAQDFRAQAAARPASFDAVATLADDPCLIAFTSGTTGKPKGCIHFHRDVMIICEAVGVRLLAMNEDDVVVGSPPLAFTFGLGGLLLFPLYTGASAVLLAQPAPAKLAPAIEAHEATVCFTAPTAYRAMLLLEPEHRFPSLRTAVSAGENLPRAIFDAWKARTGLDLVNGIGATELLHIFIGAAGDAIRPGATGLPLPGWEARVIDEEGRPLPDGETGRLAVRGPIGCRYLADERQTRYAVDGWNVTGDAFKRDSDGYFWFQARADDMIVSSGYNIAGPEVEDALLKHPAVLEVGVVAAPDPERGSIVKAFVVARAEAEPGPELVLELQNHVKAMIAPYKYPRAVEFVDTLPKANTGKIQRFKLREIASAGTVGA